MVPEQPSWPSIISWVQHLREAQVTEQERTELLEQLYGVLVAPWKEKLKSDDRVILYLARPERSFL